MDPDRLLIETRPRLKIPYTSKFAGCYMNTPSDDPVDTRIPFRLELMVLALQDHLLENRDALTLIREAADHVSRLPELPPATTKIKVEVDSPSGVFSIKVADGAIVFNLQPTLEFRGDRRVSLMNSVEWPPRNPAKWCLIRNDIFEIFAGVTEIIVEGTVDEEIYILNPDR